MPSTFTSTSYVRPGDVKHSLASVKVLKVRVGVRVLVKFPAGLAALTRERSGDHR